MSDLSVITELRARAQEESWALRFATRRIRVGWEQRAACRGLDIEDWFSPTSSRRGRQAVSICHGCIARIDCGATAFLEDEADKRLCTGIRAGFSGLTRHRMRSKVSPFRVDDRTTVR